MSEMAASAPRIRTGDALLAAIAVGVVLGLIAQVLRQVQGETSFFGGSTAPWVSIGFAIAVLAVRIRAPGRVVFGYLVAWLVAYHVLYAVGQSIPLSAAWREAVPWLVLAPPVCFALGRVATLATGSGVIADLCLAAPLAWSVPETINNFRAGYPVVAVAVALFAFLPGVASQRRDVRILTLAIGVVALGAIVLLVGPLVRSHIRS